jgi:hypothetical protein
MHDHSLPVVQHCSAARLSILSGQCFLVRRVWPGYRQHLEALTLRVTSLVLSRSVTGNQKLPQEAIKTATPFKFRGGLIGGLRSSHYRTLNILKRAAIAAFILAVLCFLWFEFRQDGELSLPANNVRSIVSRPKNSPDRSSPGTGDLPPSKAGLTFTRFGLWEPANSSPALLGKQGSRTRRPRRQQRGREAHHLRRNRTLVEKR